MYCHNFYNRQARKVALQGPFLHFTDELPEAWGGQLPCPKSHSKWKSWHGTPGKFEVDCMFSLLTMTAFTLLPGRHSTLRIGFKKVTRETHHQVAQRGAISYCSVFFPWQVSQNGIVHPQSVHLSLVRAPPELCLRRRVGERTQILKISYEESKEASVSLKVCVYLLTM